CQFQMTWPVVFRDIPDHLYTGYAQDEWKVRPRLTLNLGLRVDYQTMAWDEWVSMSRYPRSVAYGEFDAVGAAAPRCCVGSRGQRRVGRARRHRHRVPGVFQRQPGQRAGRAAAEQHQ